MSEAATIAEAMTRDRAAYGHLCVALIHIRIAAEILRRTAPAVAGGIDRSATRLGAQLPDFVQIAKRGAA